MLHNNLRTIALNDACEEQEVINNLWQIARIVIEVMTRYRSSNCVDEKDTPIKELNELLGEKEHKEKNIAAKENRNAEHVKELEDKNMVNECIVENLKEALGKTTLCGPLFLLFS